MKSLACVVLLAALAAACAKQGPAREPAVLERHDVLPRHDVCSDAAFGAVCAPASDATPVQVDTNLKAASRTANLG